MAEHSLAIAEVKIWAETLFSALERSGITTVPINDQYYRAVAGNIFDLSENDEWGVGDVCDDICDLRSAMADYNANEGMVLWDALEHLQGIVGFLAHTAESTGTVAFLKNDGEA